MRIAYKACSKKENNVTWGVTGPQGATGATGPQGATGAAGQDRSGYAIVKDANGSRIQNVVDLNWKDGGPIVLKDGLLWSFNRTTGEPNAIKGTHMSYLDAQCTPPFIISPGPNIDTSFSEQDTFVTYNNIGVLQPGFYKFKNEILHDDFALIYEKYNDGSCWLNGNGVSPYYDLETVTPPASLPAPLTLEFQ